MYILDTDHLSLVQRRGQEGQRILNRLAVIDVEEIFVTIVTYEEQVRGRLAIVSKAKNTKEQVRAYRWLTKLLEDYRSIQVFPFDTDSVETYQQLRKAHPRLGSMDLKIAATALVQRAVLLTRNASDFSQIEELVLEDWSRA